MDRHAERPYPDRGDGDVNRVPSHWTEMPHAPWRRWPRASDALLAAVLVLTTVLMATKPDGATVVRSPADVPLAVLALFVLTAAALYWRRRAPVLVLAVAVLGWALTAGSEWSQLGPVVVVALYSAGRHAGDSRSAPVGVAAAAAVAAADGVLLQAPLAETAAAATVMVASWFVGRGMWLRGQAAAQRRREEAAQAQRVLAEERTRIARELHDVVAHQVSLMTVQAAAARVVAATDGDAAMRAMRAVEDAGRQALGELRHLLDVLRPAGEGGALGPQPGLANLRALAEQVREAGVDVQLTVDGVAPELAGRTDVFAYRIAQEALTNVLKHAGPGSRARVTVSFDSTGIWINVVDDGPVSWQLPEGDEPSAATGGHGIVGMRERTVLLGGRFSAGPRPQGGFGVSAHLPTSGITT